MPGIHPAREDIGIDTKAPGGRLGWIRPGGGGLVAAAGLVGAVPTVTAGGAAVVVAGAVLTVTAGGADGLGGKVAGTGVVVVVVVGIGIGIGMGGCQS
jgi:hypothetical protein